MSDLTLWETKAANLNWWKPLAVVGVAIVVVVVFLLIPTTPQEVKKPKKQQTVEELMPAEEKVDWNNF